MDTPIDEGVMPTDGKRNDPADFLDDPDFLANVGKIIRIDPGTGGQTLLTSGGNLVEPKGIAVEQVLVGAVLAVGAPRACYGNLIKESEFHREVTSAIQRPRV